MKPIYGSRYPQENCPASSEGRTLKNYIRELFYSSIKESERAFLCSENKDCPKSVYQSLIGTVPIFEKASYYLENENMMCSGKFFKAFETVKSYFAKKFHKYFESVQNIFMENSFNEKVFMEKDCSGKTFMENSFKENGLNETFIEKSENQKYEMDSRNKFLRKTFLRKDLRKKWEEFSVSVNILCLVQSCNSKCTLP